MLIWLLKAFGKGWNNPEIEDQLTWEWLCNAGMKPTRRMVENEKQAQAYLKGE